jgi:hypothetical protein
MKVGDKCPPIAGLEFIQGESVAVPCPGVVTVLEFVTRFLYVFSSEFCAFFWWKNGRNWPENASEMTGEEKKKTEMWMERILVIDFFFFFVCF